MCLTPQDTPATLCYWVLDSMALNDRGGEGGG